MNYKLLKSYLIEIIFLFYLVIIYIFKLYRDNGIDFANFVFFILFCVLCFYLYGFSINRSKLKDIVFKQVIIGVLFYYFVLYIFGLITGFLRSPYSFSFIGIFKNTVFLILLRIVQELVRYMYIRVNKNKHVKIVFITILFILLDVGLGFYAYGLNDVYSIFKCFGLLIFPTIANHLFLSYLCWKVGYGSSILFRLMMEIPIFLLPIIPNFSIYLQSVISMSFPIIMFFYLDIVLEKYEKNKVSKRNKTNIIFFLTSSFILTTLVILISGIFKYHMIAIASGSMHPTIKIGDAVIIEKINSDELGLLEEGEILAFNYNNNIVVHRIERIILVNGNYQLVTKGDANLEVDDYILNEKDVVGIVNIRIPYIGFPSVWLRSLFN